VNFLNKKRTIARLSLHNAVLLSTCL